MVSRRDIRCGGQECPCSSDRWHGKAKFEQQDHSSDKRRPASGTPFVFTCEQDTANFGMLLPPSHTRPMHSRAIACALPLLIVGQAERVEVFFAVHPALLTVDTCF